MSQKLGLVPSSTLEHRTLVSASYAGGKLCERDDLVLNRLKAHLGVFATARQSGVISPDYTVLRKTRELNVRYYEHVLRSPPCRGELRIRAKGLVEGFWRLYTDDFGDIRLPVPPADEQRAIVRFLDHIDGRIRRYIRAKTKLIALLNEQKQTTIERAIVDTSHRAESLLGRYLGSIEQGWSAKAAEGELGPDQWAVMTLSAVRRGVFDGGCVKPIPSTATIPAGIELVDGDLLLTRANTRERVGDTCIVQGVRPRTVLCDLVYRLVPDRTFFHPRFLMFQLLSHSLRTQIESDARGSSGTMPKIAQRHIRAWRVVRPGLDEQQRIVEHLDRAVTAIAQLQARVERDVFTLREYRTRLIADVVTGKLDVRAAAARLPDEPEDDEPVDQLSEPDDDDDDDEQQPATADTDA